jgi:hypothetical protein
LNSELAQRYRDQITSDDDFLVNHATERDRLESGGGTCALDASSPSPTPHESAAPSSVDENPSLDPSEPSSPSRPSMERKATGSGRRSHCGNMCI